RLESSIQPALATQGRITRVREKGDDTQRQFLEAAKERDDFLAFIDDRVRNVDGAMPTLFDGALTESSFKEPTQDQERGMYDVLRHLTPRTACRVSFWATVTLEHVRSGKIAEPTWLASNGGNNESGAERIDRALYAEGGGSSSAIDDCVRTVFRRMSGLPAARGNRSVFVNPTFGRAWWRERLVARILERGSLVEPREVPLQVVRRSQEYWERLVTMIVSRGSVFGSVDVQDALVNGLAKHLRDEPDTPLQSASTLRTMLRRFSNVSSSIELAVLDYEEICCLVDDLISRVQKAAT
ncbi:MAG: hypothetical protein OXQ31_07210, partial [Spirochaetaceae bacterium]|nr:hypothetical protein [Spirochaetaceae bacterium]